MLYSKFCSFLRIFSTSCCTLFCTHSILESFGISCIACLRVNWIICSLPIFRRASWFIHVLLQMTAFLHFQCSELPFANIEIKLNAVPFLSHLYQFLMKIIKPTRPYETYLSSLWFLKGYKTTNHPENHDSPSVDRPQSIFSNWQDDQG